MNFEPMRNFATNNPVTISRKKITDEQVIGWTLCRTFALLSLGDMVDLHYGVRLVDLYRDMSKLILFKEADQDNGGGIITPGELRRHVNRWSPRPSVNIMLTIR